MINSVDSIPAEAEIERPKRYLALPRSDSHSTAHYSPQFFPPRLLQQSAAAPYISQGEEEE